MNLKKINPFLLYNFLILKTSNTQCTNIFHQIGLFLITEQEKTTKTLLKTR